MPRDVSQSEINALLPDTVDNLARRFILSYDQNTELLEVLEWYANATYPDDGSGRPQEAYRRRAIAAIAKAKGERKCPRP